CGFSFHIECAEKNKDNCDPQYKDPVFTIKDRETHIFLTKFVLMKICNVCNKNLSGKANYCKKCKKYSHKSHDRSTTAPLAACPVTKQSMQSSIGNDERKRISNYKIETDGINNLEENLQRGHQTVRFTTKFVKPKDVLRQDTVMYTVKKRKDAADKTKNNQSTGEVTTKTRLWQIMTDSIKILENRSPNAKQIETWHFEDMTGIKWMPNEELYMVLSFKKFQVFVPRAQATSENAMKALSKTIRECLRPFRQLLDSRRTIDIFNSCPFHERFKIYANQVLGSGQFGIVYLALDQVTKRKVAVKCVKTKKAQDDLKQEFELIKNLKHPNILEMLTLGHDSKQIMIAMDKCAMDFLEFILNENEGLLAKDVAKFYAYQAMNGLGYLHDNNIIHRDIKPENLLINKTVTAAEPFGVVKIADFGLSRMLSQEKYRRTFCGSPNYQCKSQLYKIEALEFQSLFENHFISARKKNWKL
ncbi:MAG: Serine/threonine-protein kinase D1, partial [Marteilia pararefringens]